MAYSRVILSVVLGVVLGAAFVQSTTVKSCKNIGKVEGEMGAVEIAGCEKGPCLLMKNTSTSVEIKFKTENEVASLRNRVFARLPGIPIPLPFLGVDGRLACDKVFQADGQTPAECPLQAGTDYVYKNTIKVLTIYPTVNPTVHWGLKDDGTNKYIVCFEVQAKIVPSNVTASGA